MLTLYGIRNCDTIKQARSWLDQRGIAFKFHDYKKVGVDSARLDAWIAAMGWEPLLNRAGTTFRKLNEQDRADIDLAKARQLMMAHPSLIKRPVLEQDGTLLVGFNAAAYAAAGLEG